MSQATAEPRLTAEDRDALTPDTLRESESELDKFDSHWELYPEALHVESSDCAWEKWPTFDCRACGSDSGNVTYESSSEPADSDLPAQFAWEGIRPVCRKCGSSVHPDRVDKHQTERWKAPIVYAMLGVNRVSPFLDGLYETYDHDPLGFLEATAEDLVDIEGIGEKSARRIVVWKHYRFGDLCPDPNPEWKAVEELRQWRVLIGEVSENGQ